MYGFWTFNNWSFYFCQLIKLKSMWHIAGCKPKFRNKTFCKVLVISLSYVFVNKIWANCFPSISHFTFICIHRSSINTESIRREENQTVQVQQLNTILNVRTTTNEPEGKRMTLDPQFNSSQSFFLLQKQNSVHLSD